MKRRGLLMGAAGLLLPGAASANPHRRGDGYTTIPYIPRDAKPYFKPGPDLLSHKTEIDTLIWPAVRKINQSGWVWTAESCQGGFGHWEYPMVRLVCRTSDLGRMLTVVYQTALPDSERNSMTANWLLLRRVPSPSGWSEVRVHSESRESHQHALAYFHRLATRLKVV